MKRGQIWTVSGGPDYAGKPRPAIILQHDVFNATASVTLCPLTTHAVDAEFVRLRVEPTAGNGLRTTSYAMVDKITTVARTKLERQVGTLAAADMTRINRAVVVFLGLTGPAAR